MTPEDVEVLFSSGPQPQNNGSEDDGAGLAEQELSRRVEELRHVLVTARKLLDAGSEKLDALAQKIGDGSRDGESTVLPRGKTKEKKNHLAHKHMWFCKAHLSVQMANPMTCPSLQRYPPCAVGACLHNVQLHGENRLESLAY